MSIKSFTLTRLIALLRFMDGEQLTGKLLAYHRELPTGTLDELRALSDAQAKEPEPRRLLPSQDAIDAARYRRLHLLGCAPMGAPELDEGLVLRFSNLDAFVDADLKAYPSRGEAVPPTATVEQREDAIEAAYWDFDARHKGIAEWKGHPQSERDAFKQTLRGLIARMVHP